MSDWDDLPRRGVYETPWGALRWERRHNPDRGATFRRGGRVEVLGPFGARLGPGTIRKVTATHRGIIVDLDTGKDVLVARQYARSLT